MYQSSPKTPSLFHGRQGGSSAWPIVVSLRVPSFHVLASLRWHELDVCISNMNLRSCMEAEQDSTSPGPLPWKPPVL